MWIATYAFLAAVMDALTQATISAFYEAVLGKAYLGLFIAPTPTPTPGLILAQIVEANYTGYARQPLVWYPPFVDAAGPQNATAQSLHFQPNDSVTPNTITGAFIVTALSGGLLYLAAAFVTPVALTGPSLALNVSPVFQMAFTANYGGPYPFA